MELVLARRRDDQLLVLLERLLADATVSLVRELQLLLIELERLHELLELLFFLLAPLRGFSQVAGLSVVVAVVLLIHLDLLDSQAQAAELLVVALQTQMCDSTDEQAEGETADDRDENQKTLLTFFT